MERINYLVDFCDKYGFERIAYGKWEKKINDNSSLLILLIEPDTIQITYFIDVQLENELKRCQIWRKEAFKDFIVWQNADQTTYEQFFKRCIIDMISNIHYKILFNEDYGERI
jgi:thymidylate kinase